MPGMGTASPSMSLSTPAMIFRKVDLPEPFTPSTPILAPGKKLKVMSLRICRFGGTVFPTRFMVKTYWAIVVLDVLAERGSFVKPRSLSQGEGERRLRGVFPRQMH